MMGDALLVRATTPQPPTWGEESYIVTQSATAETSATVRPEQPASCCHAGFGSQSEQPLPAPSASFGSTPGNRLPHTLSLQPRLIVGSLTSSVPPTDVTYGDAAGQTTP